MSQRLFVAVWPSPDVVDALAAHERPEVAGLRWTDPRQWHVTVRFFGSVDDSEAGEIAAAFRELALPIGPVQANVASEARRYGNVLALPVAGLGAIAHAVVEGTAALGRPPERREFDGHLTMARATGRHSRARGSFAVDAGLSWLVLDIALMRSHLGRDGARYETIATAPLLCD